MMKIGRVLHPTDDRAERWKEPGSLTLVGGGAVSLLTLHGQCSIYKEKYMFNLLNIIVLNFCAGNISSFLVRSLK